MLEAGQLWQCRSNTNRVLIHDVKDGIAVWSDIDQGHAETPLAALEFKLTAEFDLASFKVSPNFKRRMMGVMTCG